MKYIKRLNIDFNNWNELDNFKWYNMDNINIDQLLLKYPKGIKVRIRKDSLYYKKNTKNNPRDTIGYITGYEYNIFDYYIIFVNWDNGQSNSYRVIDLEYYKEYEI
jgi:hypothetical protein